jgi:hypothetical protein
VPAAAQSAAANVGSSSQRSASADSLARLRARYEAEIRALVPQWEAAMKVAVEAARADSVVLPPDTIRLGNLTWLLDASRGSKVQEAVTRSWSWLEPAFGRGTEALRGRIFAARFRRAGTKDTTRHVIDLAQVVSKQLDVFERLNDDESVDAMAERMTAHLAKLILQGGDTAVSKWLIDPYSPGPLQEGVRERMYADLVTSASQVSSRCLAGDLKRCRDALGLVPVNDPLLEWYDPAERRLLVKRMDGLLNVGPQKVQFDECVTRHAYATCDRILRRIPGYVVPPPLPASARHHLFRIALHAGGPDAYERLMAGPARSVDARLGDAARMPVDSVISRWRNDLIDARPASPMPSPLTSWTAVAWGIAIVLISLRFSAWR